MHDIAKTENLSSLLLEMKDYMFTTHNIGQLIGQLICHESPEVEKGQIFEEEKTIPPTIPVMENGEDFFIPLEKDKLFWCFYIMKESPAEYHMLLDKKFAEEKYYKIQMVELLKQHKALLKKKKWKMSNIEDELVNQASISISTFLCLCAIQNLPVALVKGRCCYLAEGDSKLVSIIRMTEDGAGLLLAEPAVVMDKLTFYRDNYWIVDNPFGRLKGIGSYRLKALQTICHKLCIPTQTLAGKRVKKLDLYNSIKQLY